MTDSESEIVVTRAMLVDAALKNLEGMPKKTKRRAPIELEHIICDSKIKSKEAAIEEFWKIQEKHCGRRRLIAEQYITICRVHEMRSHRETQGIYIVFYTVPARILKRAREKAKEHELNAPTANQI